MKRLAITSLWGLLALLQPAIALPRHLIEPRHEPHHGEHHHTKKCVSNGYLYHSGTSYLMSGKSYIIHCGKNSKNEAFDSLNIPSGGFSACSESCGFAFDCGGFSFIGVAESGVCHLKNGLGELTGAADDCVTGVLDPDGKGIQPEPWNGPVPYFDPFDPAVWSGASSYASGPDASSYGSLPSSYPSVPSSYISAVPSYSSVPSSYPSIPASSVSSPSTSLSAYTSPPPSPTSAPIPTPSAVYQCLQTVHDSGKIYRGGNGSPYELQCGEDHYGGDLAAAGSATFLGCVDICNANPECIGYSYLGATCYLKKYLNAPNSNPAVDFALNLDRNATAKPPPSSTSEAVKSPTATPTPEPGSCGYIAAKGDKTYTDSDNEQYTIECSTDHNGGDIGAVGAKDFVGCMDACDKKDKCIAFSWVGGNGPGTCYLKGTVTDTEHDVYVDYAYKKTPTYIPGSSSSSASSYGSESTGAVVISSPEPYTTPTPVAPTSTYVPPTSYVSLPSASSYETSDGDGVLTVTVTSYTGSATSYKGSATPSSFSKKSIVHPQPDPDFPWPLWPNPTKLPPTKSQHHHPPSVHNPPPIPEPATAYTSPTYTKTAWVTSATPTPNPPNGPPPGLPDWPIPFGKPPFDRPGGPLPKPPNGPPPVPIGKPPNIPPPGPPRNPLNGRPFDQPPNIPPPGPPRNPLNGRPFDQPPDIPYGYDLPPFGPRKGSPPNPYDGPDIPYFGKGPRFPPNKRRSIPDEPTKTYTKEPLMPTSVGDSAYCDELRSRKPKKLRVEVLEGDYKFIGMWLRDPTRGQ